MKNQMIRLMLAILLCLPAVCSGQSAANFGIKWVQGTAINFITDFSQNPPLNQYYDTSYPAPHAWYAFSNSNLCDSFGNLLATTNALDLFKGNKTLFVNGDSLVPPLTYDIYYPYTTILQGSIILPFTDSAATLFVANFSDTNIVHANTGDTNYFLDLLLEHRLSMKAEDEYGTVVRKAPFVSSGLQFSLTRMTAVRHGNGSDWWLSKGAAKVNTIYTYHVAKDTTYPPLVQSFPEPYFGIVELSGQAKFSRDGSMYAAATWLSEKVFLSDFDRCTGLYSNPRTFLVPPGYINYPYDSSEVECCITGVEFSPNGRFVYVSRRYNVFQLDLEDANAATRWHHVGGIDTSFVPIFNLYLGIDIGPDNRLYLGNGSGYSAAMSVVSNPDEKGLACGWCPKCMQFPKDTSVGGFVGYGVSNAPNMPNYALGPANPPCGMAVAPVANPSKQAGISLSPNPTTGQLRVNYSAVAGR